MQLSRTERWILYNQHRILEFLCDDASEKRHLQAAQTVFYSGYESEYEEYCPVTDSVFPAALGEKIKTIISMYMSMQAGYAKLPPNEQSSIPPHEVLFPGFDGNRETHLMAFARFYCSEQQDPLAIDLAREGSFNSHRPMYQTYDRMLAMWENCPSKYDLSKDDIVRILDAYHDR